MPEVAAVPYHPVEVASPEERQRFCAAPGFAVLPVHVLERRRPDAMWLLTDDSGAIVARCSLWWRGAPTHERHRLGLIGHYAVRNPQGAAQLLELACARLAEHGCTLAVGPMDGNTWQNYRLVVEAGREPPFFLEPTNPGDWPGHFLARGFTILAHYYSALTTDLTQTDPGLAEVAGQLDSLGVRLRPLRLHELPEELSRIHALSSECFRDSLLFAPIAREDFLAQYMELAGCVRAELILIAERGESMIGYIFAVPDLLQAQRGQAIDTIIIKTLAVHPEFHGAGVGRLLAARCHEAACALGYRRAIHALMLDTSAARKISDRIARPMRRYALFARALESGVRSQESGVRNQ